MTVRQPCWCGKCCMNKFSPAYLKPAILFKPAALERFPLMDTRIKRRRRRRRRGRRRNLSSVYSKSRSDNIDSYFSLFTQMNPSVQQIIRLIRGGKNLHRHTRVRSFGNDRLVLIPGLPNPRCAWPGSDRPLRPELSTSANSYGWLEPELNCVGS